MYEMRSGSFLRGVYDGIFLSVVKRHWKKEGREEARKEGMLVNNPATASP
jgi:hypothetical protein